MWQRSNWIFRVLVVCFLVPKETKCNLKPGWAGWIAGWMYPSPTSLTRTVHSTTYGSHKVSYRLAGFPDNPGNTLGSTPRQLLWFPAGPCRTWMVYCATLLLFSSQGWNGIYILEAYTAKNTTCLFRKLTKKTAMAKLEAKQLSAVHKRFVHISHWPQSWSPSSKDCVLFCSYTFHIMVNSAYLSYTFWEIFHSKPYFVTIPGPKRHSHKHTSSHDLSLQQDLRLRNECDLVWMCGLLDGCSKSLG